MASYRKYGINPLLIQAVTGKEISEISTSPTVTSLPGNYAKKIAQSMEEGTKTEPKNSYILTCRKCGRNGKYDLGRIVVDKTTSGPEGFQFTGYFRCHHCNSAGQWDIPTHTRTMLQLAVMGEVLGTRAGFDLEKVAFGKLTSADGHTFRFTTDLEEHYLSRLQQKPGDAWLWNRLGNAYYKGDRADLAVVAFEESLKYDSGQTESHYSLGRILYEEGEMEAAASHIFWMLLTARNYERIEPVTLRNILAEGLRILMEIKNDVENFFDFLPKADDFAEERAKFDERKENSGYLTILDMEIDFHELEGLYQLAEVYMGEQQKKLPKNEQTLSLSRMNSNPVIHPKKKKPPKKKGKRKIHS